MLKIYHIDKLLPHEKVCSLRLKEIKSEIIQKQAIFPILVEQKFNIILDGHHRFEVCKILGFSKIPVYLVDYSNDELIKVSHWQKNQKVTKKQIIDIALKKQLLPPKTSKHKILINLKLKSINISKCL
jgi:L-serine kinase (ADP)